MYNWVDVVRFEESYQGQSPADIMPTISRCDFTWCAQYLDSTTFANGILSDFPRFNVPLVDEDDLDGYVPQSGFVPRKILQQYPSSIFQIDTRLSFQFHYMLASLLQNTVFNIKDNHLDDTNVTGGASRFLLCRLPHHLNRWYQNRKEVLLILRQPWRYIQNYEQHCAERH